MDFECECAHSIYIVRNIDKMNFIDYLAQYKVTAEIPESFIKGDCDADMLNKITVKMLISEFLVVDLDNFNDLNSGKIKSFVYGEMFDLANMILGRPRTNNLKLFIVTNLDASALKHSIFGSNKSLKMRTKELFVENL